MKNICHLPSLWKAAIAILVFVYSTEGYVSGREELVSLEHVVMASEVIVIGKNIGEPVQMKTKDGLAGYSLQKFKVTKVVGPQNISLDEIQISNFDPYMYGIIKFAAEKRGNRIGLFKKYRPGAFKSDQIIVFLKKPHNESQGDYQYALPGAFDSASVETQVREIWATNKKAYTTSQATVRPPRPSKSAPKMITGPNTYQSFRAKVTAVKPVTINMGTSDTTSKETEKLEVQIEVLSQKTFVRGTSDSKVVSTDGSAEDKLMPDMKSEVLPFVYLPPSEKVKPGDILEGITRDKKTISRGWIGPEHLASYKINPK